MDGILSIRGPLKLLIVVGPSFGDAPHRIYCLGEGHSRRYFVRRRKGLEALLPERNWMAGVN